LGYHNASRLITVHERQTMPNHDIAARPVAEGRHLLTGVVAAACEKNEALFFTFGGQ
jgi:hypothetical protein